MTGLLAGFRQVLSKSTVDDLGRAHHFSRLFAVFSTEECAGSGGNSEAYIASQKVDSRFLHLMLAHDRCFVCCQEALFFD